MSDQDEPRDDRADGGAPRHGDSGRGRNDRAGRPQRDSGPLRPRRDDDASRAPGAGGDRRPRRDGDERRPLRADGDRRPQRDGEGFRPRRDGDTAARRPRTGEGTGRPSFRSDDRARTVGGGGAAGRRSTERGGRTPGSDRPAREGGARRGPRDDAGRPREGAEHRAGGPGRHTDEPQVPDDVRAADLDKGARNELRTLSKENAEEVARHLVMASRLIDDDPAEAHRHALAAGRRAGRVAVVRESLAITAYATGDFALAIRELRTFRRISGSDDQIALMVDSERGVGRPDRALELGRSVDRTTLPLEAQVGLAIAMSGARLDQADARAALDELERAPLDLQRVHPWSPGLYEAFAAVHDDLEDADEAARWRARAETAERVLDEALAEDDELTVETEDVETEDVETEDVETEDVETEDVEPGAASTGGEEEAHDVETAPVADESAPAAEPEQEQD